MILAPVGFFAQQAAAASFLLDSISTSAVFAHSTRKLRSAYAGSAFQVKRSSDSATQDIGFDGSGNLDTAALATFIGANTGTISIWYDQTGNGNHMTTTVGDVRSSGANNTIGSNSRVAALWSTAMGSYATLGQNLTNNRTFIMVGKLNSNSVSYALSAAGDGGLAMSSGDVSAGDMAFGKINVASIAASSGGVVGTTNPQCLMWSFDNSNGNYTAYVDGTSVLSGTTGTRLNASALRFGDYPTNLSAAPWRGYVGEMVMFDGSGAFSSTDRATIFSNQKTYWGTP